jgi:hypothetical protein
MRERLQWKERGTVRYASEGHIRYRITMSKPGPTWVWIASMNGAKIGGSFKSLEEVVEYIEAGRREDA